jgi:hypothetical protein
MDPKKTYEAACHLLKEGYENLSTITNNQLGMKNVYEDSALSFERAISKITLLKKYAKKQARSWTMGYTSGNTTDGGKRKTRKRKGSKSR